jgi:hypothetical protein
MKTRILSFLILSIVFLSFSSFKYITDLRNPAPNKQNKDGIEFCNQTIKYKGDKIRKGDSEETPTVTEITINPIKKVISVLSNVPEMESVKYDAHIESIECSVDSKLTSGKAVYNGYVEREDSKSIIRLVLEAKDGKITITSYDDEGDFAIHIPINKWEVIKK